MKARMKPYLWASLLLVLALVVTACAGERAFQGQSLGPGHAGV